jgi:hypothetical protein
VNARHHVFRSAREYHAALAAYARALRMNADLEGVVQHALGASLAYRRALDRWMAEEPANPNCRRRALAAKRLLHCASVKYNTAQRRNSPRVALPSD